MYYNVLTLGGLMSLAGGWYRVFELSLASTPEINKWIYISRLYYFFLSLWLRQSFLELKNRSKCLNKNY